MEHGAPPGQDRRDRMLTETSNPSNDARKAERLRRKIERQHDWRVKVWAECEMRIKAAHAELAGMGHSMPDLYKPDFENEAMLEQYSMIKLTR